MQYTVDPFGLFAMFSTIFICACITSLVCPDC